MPMATCHIAVGRHRIRSPGPRFTAALASKCDTYILFVKWTDQPSRQQRRSWIPCSGMETFFSLVRRPEKRTRALECPVPLIDKLKSEPNLEVSRQCMRAHGAPQTARPTGTAPCSHRWTVLRLRARLKFLRESKYFLWNSYVLNGALGLNPTTCILKA